MQPWYITCQGPDGKDMAPFGEFEVSVCSKRTTHKVAGEGENIQEQHSALALVM